MIYKCVWDGSRAQNEIFYWHTGVVYITLLDHFYSFPKVRQGPVWNSFAPNNWGQKWPARRQGRTEVPVLGDWSWSLRINDQQDQTGQTWAPCWNTQLYTACEALDQQNKTNSIPVFDKQRSNLNPYSSVDCLICCSSGWNKKCIKNLLTEGALLNLAAIWTPLSSVLRMDSFKYRC